MFQQFYGLSRKPFDIIPNPGILYESEKHRQALTYLQYGFSENIGFVLFTGEIGTGKTTLLRHLLTKVSGDVDVAVVFNTNVNAQDLLRLILIELEVEGAGQDKSHNLDLLNQHLIEVFRQGRRCLLIIDEAQNLSAEALEEVRLLSNLQTDTQPLLQIILAGQPELRDVIKSPGLEQLAQRVAISYHLAPLSRAELAEYVKYRLVMAGSEDGEIFTAEALDLLYEHSHGIPRSVNIYCNAALVYGYADSLTTIGRDVIEQILADNIGIEPHRTANPELVVDGRRGFEPASAVSGACDEKRIAHLESMVSKLAAQVNWQSGQIEGGIVEGNEKLVKSLVDLLEKERARSERYLGRSIALFHKNRLLTQQIEAMRGLDGEGGPAWPENDEREKKRFGFLASLFGK